MDLTLVISLTTLALCLVGLSWFAGTDAPYVPTKMDKINEVLKKAGTEKGKVFYELGSGDGRVVIEAAKLGAKSIGIEQSWLRVFYSRYKSRNLKLNNTIFYHGDIFKREYFPADIIYIYMLSKAVEKLESKLKKELKISSIVITQTYHFKSWKPYQKLGNFWFYRT